MKTAYRTLILFLTLTVSLAGCFSTAHSKSTQEQQLSSGQIINIMMTVDKMEVALSQIATQKQATPIVESFAQYLIRQHQGNLDKLTQLTGQWKLEPQKSSVSNSLLDTWKQMHQKLDPLQGSEFDIAFVNAMVESHQAGLKLIKAQLLPDANTPQLKECVEQFRTMVAHHLERALKIHKRLQS